MLGEDQPHPCPECGERRVRGVNGSKRWCIGCGANWPTAGDFLADVAAAAGQPLAVRREATIRRLTALVAHLTPAQLEQVELTLARLEAPAETIN